MENKGNRKGMEPHRQEKSYSEMESCREMESHKEMESHREATAERSEKVRELLGEIPPSLVRWGTAIIVIVFAALAAAVCLLPYPYADGETILRHLLR